MELRELPYEVLRKELMRRHFCLCNRPQTCDYCDKPLDSEPPCVHPERHYIYGRSQSDASAKSDIP